jgi:hypothetical protein
MKTDRKTKQFLVTVSAGKRLIGKALCRMACIQEALRSHTLVIVCGSTNAYAAEEILSMIHQEEGFDRHSFLRGIKAAPWQKGIKSVYSGQDVVIEKGIWKKEENLFDAAPRLKRGDVILKGANAVDEAHTMAGIQIANPRLGTSAPILECTAGRQVRLVIPVGLEKRIPGSVAEAAALVNGPESTGLRLLPVTGDIVTETEALEILCGVQVRLTGAGGIFGAEGSLYLSVTGTDEELQKVSEVMEGVVREEPFGVLTREG